MNNQNFKRNFIFKILITGNASVGKTSLLRRYVDGLFDESSIMTVGVDFFIKELDFDNARCLLQLWDLGGQERFRYLLESFVMGARGALLLFDSTNMPLIQDILEWVNIARLHDINLPILLVGTKVDLEGLIAVDDESAIHIKNTFNMLDYIKTSAKTDYNIEKGFEILIKYLTEISRY
ncbi:MAG: GTP-binding protein [Promethearchaeota archaeon]|nr:MAG: GTP-binding protein [Candidatus Lokiarchaeota archaeon]